jgi:hypothetical protein
MRYRSLIIGALTALLLSLVPPVTAKATDCPPAGSGPVAPADSQAYTVPPNFATGLLGPATMPTGAVGLLLGGYNRLGVPPMDAKAFLDKYYKITGEDPTTHKKTGDWIWPTNFGFAGTPQPYTLKPGQLVDRFGSPFGQFLAAEKGTPFAARGLPPQSLNTQHDQTEANYHVYCVLKDLKIQSGKIAPAFAQPGDGIQYFLGNARVMDLIAGKNLVEVAP